MSSHLYLDVWCRDDRDEHTVNEIAADVYRIADLPTPRMIFDIGANIGAFSLSAARKWPRARIIAFEPETSNFEMLKHNLIHADIKTVSPIRAAVWIPDVPEVTITSEGPGSVIQENGSGEVVRTMSLDHIVDKFGPVDLLKIDIEGAEVDVLLGAAPDTMRKVSRIIGEFHGWGDKRWTEWLRYVAAFFEVTVAAHSYPLHPYGGMFWANPRR